MSSRLLPLLLLAGVLLWAEQGRWGRQGAIVLLAVDLGLAAQLLLAPVSPWLPSLAWLVLALPAADLAARVPERTARTLLVVGLGYLLAVLIVWPVWVLPSAALLGPVRVQVPLELLGMGVLLRWRQVSGRPPLAHHPAWQRVHPFLLEALLISFTLILLWELAPLARSVAWSLLALILASRPGMRQPTGRAALYALPMSWLGMAQLVAALRSIRLEGLAWTWAGHGLVLGAVALQVAFVVLHHRRDRPDAEGFPPALAGLGALLAKANRHRLAAVDVPMLAGVALAIYWRVDAGLLTLLWSAQAFLVFSLSAWLRNNPLRHLALVGLGGCLLRLLTVDLARADLGLKGAVFLGVGILLLAMNAMVNRFSSRFG